MRLAYFCIFLFYCLTRSFAAPPPVPFDRWNNQGGNIQAACPAGYTCNVNVLSDNMIQRILTRNNSGETYVQTIIEDNSRTNGLHKSETFVNASNNGGSSIPLTPADELGIIIPVTPIPGADTTEIANISSVNSGIATRVTIDQPGAVRSMTYSYVLNTGWARNPNQAAFQVQQQLKDRTPQGIGFDYTFDYTQNRNGANRVTGWLYGINQFVQNSAVIGQGNGGTRDDQRFVLRRASGDFITAGQAVLPPVAGGGMGAMGGGGATTPNPANGGGAPPPGSLTTAPQATPFPNPPGAQTGSPMGMGGGGIPPGGTVAWNTGNEVQVIWIGQVCPGCMIGMGGMGMMGGAGSFGFQQYQNLSRPNAWAATRTIQGTGPFTWTNPPFGVQPRL